MRLTAEMLAAGRSDRAIAAAIGGVSRMAVSRHRVNHVEKPARLIVAAANRDKDARDERARAVAAAEGGDPVAWLGLQAIVTDLKRVHARLEETADTAQKNNQSVAVAALSGQQLRTNEMRARLGSAPGYAPARDEKVMGQPFVLNINFAGGAGSPGHTMRIAGSTVLDPDEIPAATMALPGVLEEDEEGLDDGGV